MPNTTINHDFDENAIVIQYSGKLSYSEKDAFEKQVNKALDQDATPNVVLDMDQVEFIDSSGISTLLFIFQRAFRMGKSFFLYRPQPRIEEVMDSLKLTTYFKIIHTPEDLELALIK